MIHWRRVMTIGMELLLPYPKSYWKLGRLSGVAQRSLCYGRMTLTICMLESPLQIGERQE